MKQHAVKPAIQRLFAQIRQSQKLDEAYERVRAHLKVSTAPSVRQAHEEVQAAIDSAKKAVEEVRSKCRHAFETIGEANPPFEVCVDCGLTQAPTDPNPAAGRAR